MSKRIIIGVLAVLCLAGCSQKTNQDIVQSTEQKIGSKSENEEIKTEKATDQAPVGEGIDENFRNHFYEIKIDGDLITLPSSYEDLEEVGLHMLQADNDIVGFNGAVAAISIWEDRVNDFLTVKYRYKGDDRGRDIKTCDGVYLAWSKESASGLDIEFYGGIKADSTREEVAAVLNEVYADESSAEYSLYLDDDESAGMMVYFNGDELRSIEVSNFTDYVQ